MTQNGSGAILKAEGLGKTYRTESGDLTVLDGIDLAVAQGASCAIVGPSGSGKTTLLGLCAGLDQPSRGTIELDGRSVGELTEDQRAELRNDLVGFVFQNFQLIPTLTAVENVLVPLELSGRKADPAEAIALLEKVGLGARANHFPVQLSGGEQQRVALARAFIHRPQILFADEPTGNLDAESSEVIEDMLFALNREAGTALVIVTHDIELANLAETVVEMKGGRIARVRNGKTRYQVS